MELIVYIPVNGYSIPCSVLLSSFPSSSSAPSSFNLCTAFRTNRGNRDTKSTAVASSSRRAANGDLGVKYLSCMASTAMKTAGGMSETISDAKSLSNFIRPMVLNLQGEGGGVILNHHHMFIATILIVRMRDYRKNYILGSPASNWRNTPGYYTRYVLKLIVHVSTCRRV